MLRKVVFKALEGDTESEQELIKVCSGFALAYLKQRIRKDAYLFSLISGSLKSLALDCIAELFEKKEGKLVVLSQYFLAFQDSNRSESDYHTHLRRLVFSKANETIYNYYRSFDPSLGKIIRNIKRVLSEDKPDGFGYHSKKGVIFFSVADSEPGLPLMPPELVEIRLGIHFKNCSNTKEVLEAVCLIAERYPEYSIRIHIAELAQVIRNLYRFYNEPAETEILQDHKKLAQEELNAMIKERVKKTKLDLYPSYVAKSKISDEDFSRYFIITEQVLKGEYVEGDRKSFYDHFKDIAGNVSNEEYRKSHRQYLEYFVKHSRDNLIQYLKNHT